MKAGEFIQRARRASRHPPRYLLKRVAEMTTYAMRRPWSNVYPHLVTPRTVARASGSGSIDELWTQLQRTPFFCSAADHKAWTDAYRTRYPAEPAKVIAAADRVLRHEFDLLGSGCVRLGHTLPWHTDFKTGREWPIEYAPQMDYSELDRESDIKIPWELSRSQHFATLGQAYWLTGDERYAAEFTGEVNDWIARNPWAYGVNWACAMDVALRAVNWIWGFAYMSDSAACASPAFRGEFLRTLYLHGEYVAMNVERADVNGNHYLCDAVGLVFLGSFFQSAAKGRQWLQTGREMIEAEIFNQTSEDGVDFEKSVPYHRLVLEAFLTCGVLAARRGEPFSAAWQARLERMLEFVEAYVKPDGRIPLIGDADDGRIQKLGTQGINDHRYLLSTGAALLGHPDWKRAAAMFWDESFWLLGPEGAAAFDGVADTTAPVGSKAFPDGGFFILRCDRAHVIVDCGEVGMNGRGGHGHNDILGFELWLDGMNIVTDCGAYLYTASATWRNRFRSTAFHNVVQVDDEELNRFISADHLWQLHDDARPIDVSWRWGERVDEFHGGHTGYRRLTPPVDVTRDVELLKDVPEVRLHDVIAGAGVRTLVWRFHLDPAVTATIDANDVRLSAAGGETWLQFTSARGALSPAIERGWVSASYGVRTEIAVVTFRGRLQLPHAASFRIGRSRLPANRLNELAAGRAATPMVGAR